MIYEIDYAFCALSAFFFKNFFTFALFLLLGYFIFKYFIQKLSNISVILYLLFMITIFAGGIVLSFIPSKEDVMCSTVVNSYYLGIVALVLLVLLIVSIIVDLITMLKKPKEGIKEKKANKKKSK